MTLRKLLWSLWPHKHVFGRARDFTNDDAKRMPVPLSARVKDCRLCGATKPVKRRVRKAVP